MRVDTCRCGDNTMATLDNDTISKILEQDSVNAYRKELNITKISELDKTSLMKDFLIELMLTKQWSGFQSVLIERDDESESWHISDYAHKIGLLKWANEGDYKYEVSVRGKKYLEQRS
jgi:hypothetical protein